MKDLRFLTDHYDEKIERIKKINAPLNFIFITDLHFSLNKLGNEIRGIEGQYEWATDHIASMQYILDRCPIDFLVCGGDVVNEETDLRGTMTEVLDAFNKLNIPIHRVVGNHDDGVAYALWAKLDAVSFCINAEEMHRLWMQCSPTEENYYYFDTPQGYRFVLLNTSDKPHEKQYTMGHQMIVSEKQLAWLKNEALNTENKVITVSHAPLHQMSAREISRKPNPAIIGGEELRNILHESGKVVAMICGHEHHDMMAYDGPILSISTNCDMMQECNPSCPVRVAGTINEECFDVVSIKDDMMYLTRFGAGHDRQSNLVFSTPERKPWRTYIW